jgi:signal transduction histidine kinase
MRVRVFVIVLLAIFFVGLAAILFPFSSEPKIENDSVLINDITKTVGENFEAIRADSAGLLSKENMAGDNSVDLDYAVIDVDGTLLDATRRGISEDIFSAIKHGDTIVDVESDGEVVGKIIFYNDTAAQWHKYKKIQQVGLVIVFVILMAVVGIFIFVLYKRILKPFRSLQKFASKIACGDLDAPLNMDRGNAFGAFTESFDLMRAELGAARENERKANQSKKELVASLSHDVKTPVASIKAISELMIVKAQGNSESGSDAKELEQLNTINAKADQIDLLITNMFHATLEELEELKVNPVETASVSLSKLIEDADYRNLVAIPAIPECLLWADTIRLAQVFDNILGNSYKYADTRIRVEAAIVDNYLVLDFTDGGKGVAADELPLLTQKFYRGSNASERSGSGLGLYISSFFMSEMRGALSCENTPEGFSVKVSLALV